MRRSSHEERGLKLKMDVSKYFYRSRSSHEERGLKYVRARVADCH